MQKEEWKKKAVQNSHSARQPTCKWEKPDAGSVKVIVLLLMTARRVTADGAALYVMTMVMWCLHDVDEWNI